MYNAPVCDRTVRLREPPLIRDLQPLLGWLCTLGLSIRRGEQVPKVSNGKTLVNYDRRGSGPAALLFNHSGTSNLSWSERFLETLAADFSVITLDHRGTGLSSPVSSEFSIADLAVDGLAVLDAVSIDEALIIGTSMDGMVAQEFALNHPTRVSSLVLMGTLAGSSVRVPAEGWVDELFAKAFQVDDIVERWRQLLPTIYSPTYLERYEDLALELELKGLRFTTSDTLKWHGVAVGKFDAYERLTNMTIRTMIVHGTADPIIPFENGEILSKQVPNGEFVSLVGVGHLPAVEQPVEMAARILKFETAS